MVRPPGRRPRYMVRNNETSHKAGSQRAYSARVRFSAGVDIRGPPLFGVFLFCRDYLDWYQHAFCLALVPTLIQFFTVIDFAGTEPQEIFTLVITNWSTIKGAITQKLGLLLRHPFDKAAPASIVDQR